MAVPVRLSRARVRRRPIAGNRSVPSIGASDGMQGYILLVLVLMVALVLIALSAGLQPMSAQLRRDREQELIHRGAQYARAVRKYYRKFGNYPTSLEQLEDTNHLRFLRKRYKDPETRKDFRVLRFGDAHLSLKLPGMATGPGVVPDTATQTASVAGGSSATTGSNSSSTSPSQSDSQSSSPLRSPSQMGAKGPTFGGGPIIGVASTSEKQSFHVFNKKDHYNDWEFVYDPSSDRGTLITGPYDGPPAFGSGQIQGAVPAGQTQPGTGTVFGQQPNAPPTQQQSPFGTR